MATAFGELKFGSIMLFVVLVIAIVIFRLVVKSLNAAGRSETPGQLNLGDLKSKGLLTPEEAKRVGEAMRKQYAKQAEGQKKQWAGPRADELALDPEVQRLEVMAAAGQRADGAGSETEKPEAENREAGPVVGTGQAPLMADSAPTTRAVTEAEIAEVKLPLDVQQLVDAGLLTEEEVRTVKLRLLQKNHGSPD